MGRRRLLFGGAAGALLAVGAVAALPAQASSRAFGARAEVARACADDSGRSEWPLSGASRPARTGRHRGGLDRRRRVVHAPDARPARGTDHPGRQRGDPSRALSASLEAVVDQVTRPRIFLALGLEATPSGKGSWAGAPRWPHELTERPVATLCTAAGPQSMRHLRSFGHDCCASGAGPLHRWGSA
jgi:hypothetical protein